MLDYKKNPKLKHRLIARLHCAKLSKYDEEDIIEWGCHKLYLPFLDVNFSRRLFDYINTKKQNSFDCNNFRPILQKTEKLYKKYKKLV